MSFKKDFLQCTWPRSYILFSPLVNAISVLFFVSYSMAQMIKLSQLSLFHIKSNVRVCGVFEIQVVLVVVLANNR